MKILNTVTVTGADDSIDPQQLVEIQRKYPFAEFGILLSQRHSSSGTTRFPSQQWLNELVEINRDIEPHLNLSGHICGTWVKEALLGRWPNLNVVADGLGSAFQRFQLNTHGQPHRYSSTFFNTLKRLEDECQTIIFQLDGKDGTKVALAAIEWGNTTNIAGLFDVSHGAGVLPPEWPQPISGLMCGYAGGLSPRNVVEQLPLIEHAVNGMTWIDAETSLFSDDGRQFELNTVESFLKASQPWVNK
jgi:hypothetical protein